jgi:hypothetical protein
MATWWTYIPATITGAVGGLLAYGLIHEAPQDTPCRDWLKLSEGVVVSAEQLAQHPDDPELLGQMRADARSIAGLRLTYPELRYKVETPSLDASDAVWQGAPRLAVTETQTEGAQQVYDGIAQLNAVCR